MLIGRERLGSAVLELPAFFLGLFFLGQARIRGFFGSTRQDPLCASPHVAGDYICRGGRVQISFWATFMWLGGGRDESFTQRREAAEQMTQVLDSKQGRDYW